MKTYTNKKLILLVLMGIFSGFCILHAEDFKQSKEVLNLEPFYKINIKGAATVNFIRSDKYYAEITAEESVLPLISAKVENGSFNVSFQDGAKVYLKVNKRIVINVYAPSINDIELNGYCNFLIQNELDTDTLYITINGAGGLEIPEKLKCSNLTLEISGAGKINAAKLDCKTVRAIVSGVGKITLAGKTDQLIREKNGFATIITKNLKVGEIIKE